MMNQAAFNQLTNMLYHSAANGIIISRVLNQ
jgi:hypothetical protein